MQRLGRTARAAAVAALLLAALAPARPAFAADSARTLYTRALARERDLRDEANRATLTEIRRLIQAYEAIVDRYPVSGYSDNALWQGANLSLLAYERFSLAVDRQRGIRLLAALKSEYASSSLVARAGDLERQFETVRRAVVARLAAERAGDRPVPAAPVSTRPAPVAADAPALPERVGSPAPAPAAVSIRDIKRTMLPDGVRVTIEMDGESLYRQERLENPKRVFFDLKGARPVAPLQDATLRFPGDVVREIRLGRHPQNTTRVVMDLEGVEDYSVFTLYNPFRLVIDFRQSAAAAAPAGPAPAVATGSTPPPTPLATSGPSPGDLRVEPRPVPPAAPSANANGQFSLARQLGLGVSRIVIDAGHGGHDPGASAYGLVEAELVLDVAKRLQKLLEKQPGIEVTMTRDADRFIALEERTAIANREGADLFLSIHANASRNAKARGVETYFLNFASNPEAEAVAARENATSARTMHSLPDIVRAIALNNKLDESRDFADMVQKAMVRRLGTRNRQLRDLGVKQAPFVVLIGAGMPSVLAEISFVTNKQEGQLLKTAAYRQHIAEALLDAVLRYQKSLKKMTTVAGSQ
jgi:N-acetylmuramoyl-L-alanine amidase